MKKLYTLLAFAAISTSINAQNLITNGGFENWTEGAADGITLTIPANGGSLTQETTDVHGGTSAAKFTAPAGTGNVKAAFVDFPVVGGQQYTFSYWYKDTSDDARGRHWASWRTSSAQLTDNADVLQPDYFGNTTGWQQVVITATAPATATLFRLDFRVYKDTGMSGVILYDDVALVTGPLAVNQNTIAGLKVYPNPVTNGTLFIDTNADADKSVAIFDVLGKQVINTKTSSNSVNVSNLKGGVYIVKITEEGKTATRKLVIR